jgi:4'-phosphopantetheinyl transferase
MTVVITWQDLEELPKLEPGELHLLLIKMDPKVADILFGNLSESDQNRAQTFKNLQRRTEFIFSKAASRSLLSNYLGLAASSLNIVNSKDGKPSLGGSGRRISFNISHSGDNLLVAFSNQAEVGVDIERIDPNAMDGGTVKRSLHPRELASFSGLRDDEKAPFFFERWTRKEAFLKMVGCGFAIEPSEMDLDLPGDLYEHAGHKAFFTELPPVAGYCSAAATNVLPTRTCFYTVDSTLLA